VLAVRDIGSARDDLVSRGVDVSEVYEARPPGLESQEGRSYFAYASFSDPDGNGWLFSGRTGQATTSTRAVVGDPMISTARWNGHGRHGLPRWR